MVFEINLLVYDAKLTYITAGKDYLSGNLRTISYFSFQALKKATKNFHESNLLGKGGFGPVYLVSISQKPGNEQ